MRPRIEILRVVVLLLSVGVFTAQIPAPQPMTNAAGEVVWICPMDKDIRSLVPGNCPRCGMKLASGVPDPVEYHLNLALNPVSPKPNEVARLTFDVHDPWKNNPVTKFTIMHEKLFHMFIVSEDLELFVHDHPVWTGSSFQYDYRFPRPGLYRLLGDFYPEAATPQMIAKSVIIPGTARLPEPLARDYSTKNSANLRVELKTVPEVPVAGGTTQLHVHVSPDEGLEKYLGVWGHMLAVSDDLIDMLHTHPYRADNQDIQFNVIFPRSRMHRVWLQFQRNGVVNTAHFDIPVAETPDRQSLE